MRYSSLLLAAVLTVLLTFLCSCSSISTYLYIEPLLDMRSDSDDIKIENEQCLINFLEDIINSQDYFSIEAFARRSFSPKIKQTKLLTHSFYIINLSNGEYCTLSFSGPNFRMYSDGIWVINKETDKSSYRLFIEGNNIWDVGYLFGKDLIDAHQTLRNIISAIEIGAKYYYRDHVRSRPDSFNCNSALSKTIVLNKN